MSEEKFLIIRKQMLERFWSFFRNRTKSKSLPSKIQNDSAGSTDPQGKACLFNDYFKSVFKQVDERGQDQ